MLDLKQMNDEIHQNLVGVSNHRTLEFAKYLANKNVKVWLGKHKWVAMGEEYKLDGVKPPKKETMERVKGILEQYGHKVMF